MNKCILCKSNKLNSYLKIEKYNLLKCKTCGLVFTEQSTKLNRDEINKKIYSDDYLDNYENRLKILSKRFSNRASEIEQLKNGGRLLDLGCSNGAFLQCFSKFTRYSWSLFGIDINKKSIIRAKQNLPDVVFSTKKLSTLPDHYFDVITCFDVLEHDIFVKFTLKEIKRILKDDGIIVVQCPNYKSLMCNLCGEWWDWWSVPDHVFHFSNQRLKKLLNEEFKIISSKTWESPNDFVTNIIGSIKRRNKHLFIKILLKLLKPILYLVWIISIIIKIKYPIGGLSLIYAKNK